MKILKSYSFKKWLVFGLPTLAMCVIIACSDDDGKTDDGTGGTDDDPTPETMTFTSFDPMEGERGSTVELTGTNFSTTASGNTVKFGTVDAEVTGSTPTMLTVTVPDDATSGTISVSTGTTTVTSSDEFNIITGKWRQVADFGGEQTGLNFGIEANGKGYVLTGETPAAGFSKEIWVFDPSDSENGTWSLLEDEFPGLGRWVSAGFEIADTLYIGTGLGSDYSRLKDLWAYHPSTGWMEKASLPEEASGRLSSVGFAIDGKGYIGLGEDEDYNLLDDFWEYDPVADQWSTKDDFGGGNIDNATAFVLNGYGFVVGGGKEQGTSNQVWKFDPSTPDGENWKQLGNFVDKNRSSTGFSIANKGYVVAGYNGAEHVKSVFEYDPAIDSWIKKTSFKGNSIGYFTGFSIGDIGYIVGGYEGEDEEGDDDSLTKDVWEFDPEN